MKKFILIITTLLFASGCAPKMGEIRAMPKLDGEATSEISIMRNYNFVGSGIRLYPTVNGKKIAGLFSTDYVRFRLKEGKYTFGLMVPDVIFGRWNEENKIEKKIVANNKYYFLLSPKLLDGMEIEEVDSKEGEERLSHSDRVETGNLSNDRDPIAAVLTPVANIMGLDEDDE